MALAAMMNQSQAESYTVAPPAILRIADASQLPSTRKVTIGLHRSIMVELPVDVRDVLISHPGTLDAVVMSPRKVYLLAKEVGAGNVVFLNKNGEKSLILEVLVQRDLTELTDLLHKLIPGARIHVAPAGDGIVLSGTVANAVDANRAAEIAKELLKKGTVINTLRVTQREQVLLKVSVTEMQRDGIRRLGVNVPEAVLKGGSFTFAKVINNAFPVSSVVAAALPGVPPVVQAGTALQNSWNWNGNSVSTLIQSLERMGLARTLAEPTLTAISGETAKFLAGGEFPIPVSTTKDQVTIEFKQFGVSVAFTPVVLTEGRISLKVAAEVSELSSNGAVTLQTIAIPALKVRRAETTVELPSGGGLAIAGLLSDETRQSIEGVPELKNLPVLGALFRSKDYQRKETELVIMVTPYVVKPAEREELARADEGFAPASELQGLFLGHLNRVYGKLNQKVQGRYRGDYGFIVDYEEEGELK